MILCVPPTHKYPRKDKYQKKTKKYYVETQEEDADDYEDSEKLREKETADVPWTLI